MSISIWRWFAVEHHRGLAIATSLLAPRDLVGNEELIIEGSLTPLTCKYIVTFPLTLKELVGEIATTFGNDARSIVNKRLERGTPDGRSQGRIPLQTPRQGYLFDVPFGTGIVLAQSTSLA